MTNTDHLIFDAGPLITSCKFAVENRLVIDYVLDHCQISVATSVHDEVVNAGGRYADARAAQQRIADGRIGVLSPSEQPTIATLLSVYNLGTGEYESILLGLEPAARSRTVVLDDHLAYLVSDRLGCHQRFFLDVILNMVHNERLNRDIAIAIVQAIRVRYPPAFVEHTLMVLRS